MTSETDLAHQLVEQFEHLLAESMRKLRHCVAQLDDELLWRRAIDGQNSVGNLILHLAGNLQQWCVAGITEDSDDRDRAAEFTANGGVTASVLLGRLDNVVENAMIVIRQLEAADMPQPRVIQGFEVTVLQALCHTIPHFVGHTHQIILLTRLMLKDAYRFEWPPDRARAGVPL